ncbi:TetR/AcrR family transcriptional regulator [Sphingomonas morindae]|uniref:TetR/AcrR family transcriptional regulator n=1 Tax=Sphingomonas morindae TaxID=1541170 RepID=A0ABY4XDX5_9SPHN|nr:TetR/AcrR family transcriptional regulator [Sphingomonas morindae]USI74966.1 TetR/AcrR family transcriptional regulator [Sphingomonas morindae]
MTAADRRKRERAERGRRIIAAARAIAESEGWSAVTIRRLAEQIDYSQPVLYAHFANRDAIVAAVALDGFDALAAALAEAARAAAPGRAARGVAEAYLAFADRHPALYQAMFVLPTGLRFAEADTPPPLRAAFAALAAVAPPEATDAQGWTETLWAALHGLAELERTGRIRAEARAARLALLAGLLSPAAATPETPARRSAKPRA